MRTILLTLFMSLTFSSLSGWAQPRHWMIANSGISKQQAAEIAKRDPGDQVLKVERIENGAGPVYRVKILGKKKRVRSTFVDAQSGQIRKPRK